MAERLSKLRHLQHLVYSNPTENEAEIDRSLDDGEQWSETAKHFAERCPSLRYMQLCKCRLDVDTIKRSSSCRFTHMEEVTPVVHLFILRL